MININKYLQVTKTFGQSLFVFRFDFWVARIRNLVVIFTIYFLYSSIYKFNYSLPNFSEREIMTYVLLSPIIYSLIFIYNDTEISGKISDGSLNFYLMKPMNYLAFEFFKTLSKRIVNFMTSILELLIFYIIVHPDYDLKIEKLPVMFLAILMCSVMFFVINSYSGVCAFTMPNANGPIFILRQVLEYFTGRLYPLVLLPILLQNILRFSPFWYVMYFPLDYYFNNWEAVELLKYLGIYSFWLIILAAGLQILWKRNIKLYEAYGI